MYNLHYRVGKFSEALQGYFPDLQVLFEAFYSSFG
jgi:hypothetical protein